MLPSPKEWRHRHAFVRQCGQPKRSLAIDSFKAEFLSAMADTESFGRRADRPGDAGTGVDFDDPEAVQRWIDAFNERPIEGRHDVLGPQPPAP